MADPKTKPQVFISSDKSITMTGDCSSFFERDDIPHLVAAMHSALQETNGDLFDNPVPVARKCAICHQVHLVPEATCGCYREWVMRKVHADKDFGARIKNLSGLSTSMLRTMGAKHPGILADVVEILNRPTESQPCTTSS